ncbi:hypothetical protein [Streptomyces sp. NPDC001980]|uniref:alpha/beta fold hydrolase n=1 Tax=Streptomyces sp. NPDC001980 TaxID=3157126 RepID=UPI003321208E
MTSPASSATVVLVHGAFADASSWSRVVPRLSAAGVAAVAPPDPTGGGGNDQRSRLSTMEKT